MSNDLLKSATRALEILEVFAADRKRMNAAQLGATLAYPKSSLSVLLKSLVTQDFLFAGNGDQDYFSTLKLASWADKYRLRCVAQMHYCRCWQSCVIKLEKLLRSRQKLTFICGVCKPG